MHLSANEGIEGLPFTVTGGQGFVGAALCLELLRCGAREVRSLDLRTATPWSQQLELGRGLRRHEHPPCVLEREGRRGVCVTARAKQA
ncbi:hypothetical protein C2845_PM16G21670 [Panicum miliaceum]|uniref:3-beta hydroxysteroid dehydrogenase/isomerase domain-containing protein n=1 Tax=Panicum miliaceum TaxID=4540 RepID=A0A3L6PRX3_PANMI|nr:hypothetical protein C2845_PM16G21670 [Panicum miliaceum]